MRRQLFMLAASWMVGRGGGAGLRKTLAVERGGGATCTQIIDAAEPKGPKFGHYQCTRTPWLQRLEPSALVALAGARDRQTSTVACRITALRHILDVLDSRSALRLCLNGQGSVRKVLNGEVEPLVRHSGAMWQVPVSP